MKYLSHNQWNGHNFPNFYNRVISEDFDKIIICCQNEWQWYNHDPEYWPKLQDYCKSIGKPIHVIVGAHERGFPVQLENTIVHYWPTAWFGMVYTNALRKNDWKVFIDPLEHVNYKYHFCNFNHRSKSHRCKVIDELAKHDIIKNAALSIHETEVHTGSLNGGWFHYPWKYFNFNPMELDSEFRTNIHSQIFIVTKYHKESFCHLVSETTDRAYFITEKTLLPLSAGKPFLVASKQGFHKLLKEMGFELYDEVFDYAFDDIEDEDKRYELLVDNFKRITEIPLNKLHDLTKLLAPKLIHNKNRVKEIVYERHRYPSLVHELIDHYRTTGEEVDHLLIALYNEEEFHRNHEW